MSKHLLRKVHGAVSSTYVSVVRSVSCMLNSSESSTVSMHSPTDNMYTVLCQECCTLQMALSYSSITRTVCRVRSLQPVTVHPLPRPLSLPFWSILRPNCSAVSASRCPAVNRSPLMTTGMPGGYGHI